MGNARHEPGPVALTVSPRSNVRGSHRAAAVRPSVDLVVRARLGVASGASAAHGFIEMCCHLTQFTMFGLADRPQLWTVCR